MASVSPELKARMQRCADALVARGAKAVHFTVVPSQSAPGSAEQLGTEMCSLVESYLEGRLRPFSGLE